MMNFDNEFAQLPSPFYTQMSAEGFSKHPKIVHVNAACSELLGLDPGFWDGPEAAQYFSGNQNFEGSAPLSSVYSGYQFGVFAGQLGDGRALLLGQVRGTDGGLWDLQLKGSGLTPYSRFGDGRAVLRSSIREYLCSMAMMGLGVPTTRALCLLETGESVARERLEPGAMVMRVAETHIRFGHFEHFFYNDQTEALIALVDHVIRLYFPDFFAILEPQARYLAWFRDVMARTAKLMAQWQAIGFCHGVMNTDNMSILGLTLDYGPFGFMEAFDPGYICNHSDPDGRYSYNQQPFIGLWNLKALAYALSPLIDRGVTDAALTDYEAIFTEHYEYLMAQKLGLESFEDQDRELLVGLLELMTDQRADYTQVFRGLAVSLRDSESWLALFSTPDAAQTWLTAYHARLGAISSDHFEAKLNTVNPKFVLRNWVAETAIRAAEDRGDYTVLDQVFKILETPYDAHPEATHLANAAPADLLDLEVSCSS